MKPGIYKIEEPVFIFEAGDTFNLMPDSYESNICDVCGQRKKCDWLENRVLGNGKTGMDCCRTCQKKILKEATVMGHCKDCIRWYKNAPDYGLNVTEWICDRSHPADGTCSLFVGVME